MKFPKILYVTSIDTENDKAGRWAYDNLAKIKTEPDKRREVGEYVLKRKIEVLTETTIVAEVGG